MVTIRPGAAGVDQRAALREKGSTEQTSAHDPDLLVMTATPIPRTAAMTVYGDLDYSVLDEMPPGRTPIRTIWIRDGQIDLLQMSGGVVTRNFEAKEPNSNRGRLR